jgi:hypothetical protein
VFYRKPKISTLRGAKRDHVAKRDDDMRGVERKIDLAMQSISDGNCTGAYMNVVEAWHALGQSEAEARWSGGTAWTPTSRLRELGYQFSHRCLRDEPTKLSGLFGTRAKGKRGAKKRSR